MAHGGEKDSTKKMPKKTKDQKIQIQNNWTPALQCFVIDWNINSNSDRDRISD